jgi:hypothetical protein
VPTTRLEETGTSSRQEPPSGRYSPLLHQRSEQQERPCP